MNELEKFLLAFFGTTLKLDQTKIKELLDDKGALKPDAAQTLLASDAERIRLLQEESRKVETEARTAGYNKGKGEALEQLEINLQKAYSITSGAKGPDLVKEIVTAQLEKSGKPGTITDNDVLKHPLYLQLQEKLKTDTEAIAKEWDDKWKARDQQDAQNVVTSELREHVGKLFDDSKPVLSPDPKRAAEQRKLFIDDFIRDRKVLKENGKFIPLDEKGLPKKNAYGHLEDFDTEFKTRLTSVYDLQQSDPKGSPPPPGGGNPPPPGGGNPGDRGYASLGIKAPKSEQEFTHGWEKIQTLTDDKARVAAQTHWSEDFEKSKSGQ